MVKLKPAASPKGRISQQVKTSTRTGRLRQQSTKTTVATRKKIKKKINNDGFWLW
jgi:hypothetical protein